MTDADRLSVFVDLSAVLTGFDAAQLNPPLDPLALAQEYLTFLLGKAGVPVVELLFATYQQVAAGAGGDPDKLRQGVSSAILDNPALGPLARRIIRMWYLSIWYELEPPAPFGSPGDVVISSNAYTRGLAWEAIQAHPMGFSELRYGYWADPPAPVGP